MNKPKLNDISIRTELRPGDLGYIIFLHGSFYHKEYQYGIEFESYVAQGLAAFYQQYNPAKNRVWVCEYKNEIIGFMLLMNRGEFAQLRYFIITPAFRGIGLGKKLMDLFMAFLSDSGFRSAYLWTTHELPTAASIYKRHGFKLVDEKPSEAFGKPVKEQKYELHLPSSAVKP
jgi:N-acetylglutamate synthase-like GNAT family acetyltransferase